MLETTEPMLETRRRASQTSRYKGASGEAILDAVERAAAPEDIHYLEALDRQVEEFGAARPDDEHGFLTWIWLIQRGISTLPDRIPAALLRAWIESYEAPRPHLAQYRMDTRPVSPPPFWRCFGCGVSLPHNIPHTWTDNGCPICGSLDVRYADISKPRWGDHWIDPRSHSRSA